MKVGNLAWRVDERCTRTARSDRCCDDVNAVTSAVQGLWPAGTASASSLPHNAETASSYDEVVHPAPETTCLCCFTLPLEQHKATLDFVDRDKQQEKLRGLFRVVQAGNQARTVKKRSHGFAG